MPDTSLIGPEGRLQLRDKIGKPLVVYFYPRDESYGCTKEACEFRDQYEDFVAAGAEVIGISRDDAASHAKFRQQHRLPFTLLSDPGGKVAASWGVRAPLGRVTARAQDELGVAVEVAHTGVHLGEGEAQLGHVASVSVVDACNTSVTSSVRD